ncbi:MAG: hypothetical protein QOF48_1937 [Verrucomicrobiota bacterium]|jgi:hypothetical protein
MKTILIGAALALVTMAAKPATLDGVAIGAATVPCIFNPACTNAVEQSSSPITLPGTTGSGALISRVVQGSTNSAGGGLYGYEYRIDLSGIITASNHPVCLTNVVRCKTERVEVHTNKVVCRTNLVGVSKAVICFTNTIPATNVVVCLTNAIRGTNITRCFTNAAGLSVCVTNVFPATNVVLWITNKIPARSIVACRTNVIDAGHFVVQCDTNRFSYHTNVVTCRTNISNCPGSPPCIKSIQIPFGDIASFDFNGDGTNDSLYVVTNTATGGAAVTSIKREGKKIIIRFSPPLCAGDSSASFGFLSARAPRTNDVRITLTSGSLTASARVPGGFNLAQCDFTDLAGAIGDLRTRDFLGSNDAQRESRRTALLAYGHSAELSAQSGDLDGALSALAQIIVLADGKSSDWVTRDAGRALNEKIKDLLDCLEDASGRDLDGHQENDDRDNDEDDD